MGKTRSLLQRLGLQAEQPTPERFRDLVMAELSRLRPDADVRASDLDISVRWAHRPDAAPYSVAAYYAIAASEPRQLRESAAHVASLINIAGDAPRVEWLAAIVMPADRPDGMPAQGVYARHPVAGAVVAQVVVDTPAGYQVLSLETLREELAADEPALWEHALANTRRRLDIPNMPLPPGVATQVHGADGLLPSLLLFDDFWDAPDRLAAGPELVALISPNRIVVAPLSDDAAVNAMRSDLAARPRERGWITSDLLIRREGRWKVFR